MMTARERIMAAFGHRKADRIPRYEIFLPGYVAAWRRRTGAAPDASIYDRYAKVDIGTVLADQGGPFMARAGVERREGRSFHERDSWGRLLLKKDNAFFEKELEVVYPEKGLVDRIPFESPLLPVRYAGLAEAAAAQEGRFGLVSGVLGLFMGCSRMRGDVQFLMDLVEDPVFARDLVERLADFTVQVGLRVSELTGTRETALWVYDELSSRTDVLFSPRVFETVLAPAYARMITRWKAAGIRQVVLHCDGNSLPILDMVVAAGFTGLQSLAPTAGMWLPSVKARYGGRLTLIGGMDNIRTLASGSRREIEEQARAVVEAGEEGGVIIGTHSIDDDVPLENYDHYYAVMDECDRRW